MIQWACCPRPRPAPCTVQEVKRSEEFWKREARMQRQAAASVQAEDTQRRIKFMQVGREGDGDSPGAAAVCAPACVR